jgi:hypothetical protein
MAAQKTSRFFRGSPEDNKQALPWQPRRQKAGSYVAAQKTMSRFLRESQKTISSFFREFEKTISRYFRGSPEDNKQVLP